MGDTNMEIEKANNNYRHQLYVIYFSQWKSKPSELRKDDLWTSSSGTDINPKYITFTGDKKLIVPRLYNAKKNQLVYLVDYDERFFESRTNFTKEYNLKGKDKSFRFTGSINTGPYGVVEDFVNNFEEFLEKHGHELLIDNENRVHNIKDIEEKDKGNYTKLFPQPSVA